MPIARTAWFLIHLNLSSMPIDEFNYYPSSEMPHFIANGHDHRKSKVGTIQRSSDCRDLSHISCVYSSGNIMKEKGEESVWDIEYQEDCSFSVVVKNMNGPKVALGKKELFHFMLLSDSWLLREEAKAETQAGWESEVRNWIRDHGGIMLTGFSCPP